MALLDRTDAEMPLQNKGSLRTLRRLDLEATRWGSLPSKKQNYATTRAEGTAREAQTGE